MEAMGFMLENFGPTKIPGRVTALRICIIYGAEP